MKSYKLSVGLAVIAILWMIPFITNALTFRLPSGNSNVVGQVQFTEVYAGETLADVSRRFDVGIMEMIHANPHVDPWNPRIGAEVIVPSQFVLPDAPRQGIVINLAEMRVYYYHKNEALVSTYPISIGKQGWETPLGQTKVIKKEEKPTWHVPPSILADKKAKGIMNFPTVVPPGPDNPLGDFAMRLGFSGILMHGTNQKGGIGLRVSHGCIRMKPSDIAEFFYMIDVGTPVNIVHQPYKFGYVGDDLYFEAHKPIHSYDYSASSWSNLHNDLKYSHSRFAPHTGLISDTVHRGLGIPTALNHNNHATSSFFGFKKNTTYQPKAHRSSNIGNLLFERW